MEMENSTTLNRFRPVSHRVVPVPEPVIEEVVPEPEAVVAEPIVPPVPAEPKMMTFEDYQNRGRLGDSSIYSSSSFQQFNVYNRSNDQFLIKEGTPFHTRILQLIIGRRGDGSPKSISFVTDKVLTNIPLVLRERLASVPGEYYFAHPEDLHGVTLKVASGAEYVFSICRDSLTTDNLMTQIESMAQRIHKPDSGLTLTVEKHNLTVRFLTADEFVEVERKKALQQRKNDARKRIDKMKQARLLREQMEKAGPFLEDLRKTAQMIYPDLWDISRNEEPTNDKKTTFYHLKIRFPEVTIRNSKGLKHKILDLFITLKIDLEGRMWHSMFGERGNLNYAEFRSTYGHSHLSGGIKGMGEFCLGSDSIGMLMSDLRNSTYFRDPKRWLRRLEALLFQLEAYVAWESLEGTPFKYIKDIAVGTRRSVNVDAEVKSIISKITPDDPPPMIYMKTKGFQLSSNTEAFEDWLVKYCVAKQFKNSIGEYYNDDTQHVPLDDFVIADALPVKFRGQEIKRTVRTKFYHNGHEGQRKEYCHGQVKEQFVKWANWELERSFKERSLRSIFRGILTTKSKKTSASYSAGPQAKANYQSEFKGILENFKAVSAVPASGMVGSNVG
jgi:hypothetical protein